MMSTIQYIDLEEANRLLYIEKIVKMEDLLIYLNKTNQFNVPMIEKYNPKIVKDGKINLKVGQPKSGKIKMVCLGHPTAKDNSTNILLSSNKISCFRGGCLCRNGLNIVQVYLIFKLGIDAKLVMNPEAYRTIGKEKFRAVAELVEMRGYKIVSAKKTHRLTKEQREANTLQEILNLSADMYHKEFLVNPEGKNYFLEAEYEEKGKNGEMVKKKGRGFKYVAGEDFAIEQAKRFKVGFAPKPFPATWLYQKLAPNFTTEELLKSSVVKWVEFKDENNKVREAKPLDFHSHALVLPYWNRRNVTNLYSRALEATKDWKHLRLAGSVDVPINFAEGVRHEVVNIVEGEMTWFTKIMFGYENTLGNRGTNGLMPEHVNMLVQAREESGGAFCKTIVLAFDGDSPGAEATLITGKLLIEAGFDVRVVLMPDGMDHNDILVKYKEKAKEVYAEIYNKTVSFFTFVALAKIKEQSSTPSDMLAKMAEIKQMIVESGISDEAELYLIAKEFAERSNIPLDTVWKSWKKENKNIEAFKSQNYVFMTNDIESYYLLKFAFKEKAAYIEDLTFSFITEDINAKNIVVDGAHYADKDILAIEKFCDENELRMLTFTDLSEVIEVKIDNSALINQMLKN